jgi:alpha-mannosidase
VKSYVLHVISNTHWDREWRHPFQRMRIDLVELMDRLLEICETEPDFKHYHLDSQTILLEDYLEVRPEKRELLSKHIRNGKVLVGPWYTLPDMFLVSGEAIVRNLLRGHQVAGSLGGKAMKVGYTPCSYGQTSQIAQIYKGFDIDSIIFYRGMDAYGVKKSEYLLEGADGTRILGIKLGTTMTRFNFRFNVFSGTIHKEGGPPARILLHPCDPESQLESYSWLHTDFLKVFNPRHILAGIERAKSLLVDMATTKHLLMMDGFDASYPHANSGKIVRKARELGLRDEIIHQSFPKFIEAVKKSVDWKKLQVIRGERRTPARDTMGTSIMQGILTSHSYFKRANHDTQTLLEKYAEPISSFAWMLGAEYPARAIELGWKYLLANHGHDTICGASVDQIYVDAMERLRQSQMIAHYTTLDREREIISAVTSRKRPEAGQLLTVFNPLPYERTEVAEAYVDFPQTDKVKSFVIEDCAGKQIPYQILSRTSEYGVSESGDVAYHAYFVDKYRVAFLADGIPPLGYKCFWIREHRKPAPLRPSSLVPSPNTLENAHLRVSINRNGTIDLTDKATRRTYRNLHYFEDGGDAGTPWFYRRPKRDRVVTTLGARASIKLVEEGPLCAAYQVEVSMKAPAALAPDKSSRVKQQKKLSFVSRLRLTRESRYLEISTRVDTQARDHRLRVKFPSGIKADYSQAEGNFDLMKRPIFPEEDASSWIDKERGIQPQQSFVDLTDGKIGLGLLNRGLREFEVEEEEARPVGLTLLRGIRYPRIAGGADPWADDPIPVKCQCLGSFEFDYAIYPHRGDWERGELYAEARRFNAPLRVTQCSAGLRALKPELSFLEIGPRPLTLSALKVAESGRSLIVRVFNPTGRKLSGRIGTANAMKRARLVNLNEEPLRELELGDPHRLELEILPKKIVTLELFVRPLRFR